jgi:hypothetical protein
LNASSVPNRRKIQQPRHEDHSRRSFSSLHPLPSSLLTFVPHEQINTDLIDLPTESTFALALASSLNPDGSKDAAGSWRADIEGGLADDWEYVMYGKVRFYLFFPLFLEQN